MARKKDSFYDNLKDGDTSKLLGHLRRVAALGPRVDLNNDPQGVLKRIVDYFALCEKDDLKPTVAALSTALGLSKEGYRLWRNGKIGKNEETREHLKEAQRVMDALMEAYMQEGMINPVTGIFLMRNNFGYKNEDVPEVEEQERLPEANIQQLAEKYMRDVPIEE